MPPAIRVENVSKHYRLGARQRNGKYGTLRESIMGAVAAPMNRLRRMGARKSDQAADESLWALRDVSFTIRPGESVGIIGRNGAGKSTLLKVLSRITGPTGGRIQIRGRVGSLLEVGTGFHPELTGRENIFLNGAILGMPRKEIARKFDEIVAFSEVDKFIDTPVKRYSSGMYVRLAFAVAAHMEPDILLIDEVLSVGDLAFQRKCMEHAKRMIARDTTLLFVSHNMFSIKAMCDRAIYLARGTVEMDGTTEEVTRHYGEQARLDMAAWAQGMVGSDPGKCPIFVRAVEILDMQGQPRGVFDHGERMRVRIHYRANERIANPNFVVSMLRSDDIACCNFNTVMDGFDTGTVCGDGVIELVTPALRLVSELYSMQVLVWDGSFQRLYCAQMGRDFHVRHPILNTEFGVFHEQAAWSWAKDA
jgi:lipopolysaccharide transport system ATP-binding protein